MTSHRALLSTALVALVALGAAACGPDAAESATLPPTTVAPVTGEPAPPGTEAPPTAPAPTPTPAPAPPPPAPAPPPTTAPPPPPATEPVRVSLLGVADWTLYSTQDDGAGGSAEVEHVGNDGAGLRAYAWHGYNGSGQAHALVTATFDASPHLTDAVPVARVEVSFGASGNGVLKAPWDRQASIWAGIRSVGAFPEGAQEHVFVDESIALETEADDERWFTFSNGGMHSFLVTPEDPEVEIRFDAYCSAAGGPMAFALLNEGYCDFFEGGGIQLDRLSAVVTPLPDHQIVDGVPVG